MTKAIQIKEVGGPNVMEWVDSPIKKEGPGPGEVRIKNTAIGVNFIDTYHRSGVYPVTLPCVLGLEGVGIIEEVGEAVELFAVGDRVGYASAPLGAYSEKRDYPSDKVFKIPDFIKSEEAAGILLKGMTVEYLFNRVYKLKKGESFLFHAAAGGVGLVACQWARAIGAKMIGTVGNKEKAFLAKEYGCEHTINYKEENVVERVMDITGGRGVPIVYDGVGRDTFEITLACLHDFGLFVSFGQSSGMIEDVNLHSVFAPKNLFYTRPSLLVYNKSQKDIGVSSSLLFKMIEDKKIKIHINSKYGLKNAKEAHIDLQSRKTVGSLVLIP